MIHVIPLHDDREHEVYGSDCWCQPGVEYLDDDGDTIDGGPLVIHNAADLREVYEGLVGESYRGRLWGVVVTSLYSPEG